MHLLSMWIFIDCYHDYFPVKEFGEENHPKWEKIMLNIEIQAVSEVLLKGIAKNLQGNDKVVSKTSCELLSSSLFSTNTLLNLNLHALI